MFNDNKVFIFNKKTFKFNHKIASRDFNHQNNKNKIKNRINDCNFDNEKKNQKSLIAINDFKNVINSKIINLKKIDFKMFDFEMFNSKMSKLTIKKIKFDVNYKY